MPVGWWAWSIAIHALFAFLVWEGTRLAEPRFVWAAVFFWAIFLVADAWDLVLAYTAAKIGAEDARLKDLTSHGREPGDRVRHAAFFLAILIPTVFFAGRAFGSAVGQAAKVYRDRCALVWVEDTEEVLMRDFSGQWRKTKLPRGLGIRCNLPFGDLKSTGL